MILYKKIWMSLWVRLFVIMMVFNFPSFILSFLTKKTYIFSDINSSENLFSTYIDMIFLYRPFPDPFIVSVDVLLIVFLSLFICFKRYTRLFAIWVSCLFVYQWYTSFIVFFINKVPDFKEDWYYLFQIPTILDFHIMLLICVFVFFIALSLKCFYSLFSTFIEQIYDNKFRKRLALCLVMFSIWNIFLYKSYLTDKKNRYLTMVQCTSFNLFDNIFTYIYPKNSKAENQIEKKFQSLNYHSQNYFAENQPNVFLMIIESYGDLNMILNEKNRNELNEVISQINTYLENMNIYSISSYSTHSKFGTFGSLNTIIFGDTFSINDLNKINTQHIRSDTLTKYSLSGFFRINGYQTIGLFPSLTYNAFSAFNYTASQYSNFYDLDYFYIGTDFHNIDAPTAIFEYPDKQTLNNMFELINVDSKNHFFFTYISSNSHYPFNIQNPHKIKLDENNLGLSITSKLDKRFNIDQNNFNLSFIKYYLKETVFWDVLRKLYSKFFRLTQYINNNLGNKYKESIIYQFESIVDIINQLKKKPFVLIVVGDHQPAFNNYSEITPIHVLTNDDKYLTTWHTFVSFTKGFHLNQVERIDLSHDQVAKLILESFKDDKS